MAPLQKSSKVPIGFSLKFLNFEGKIEAGWNEIPNTRFCDFEIKGGFKLDPIISVTVDFEFTNLITSIPYFGQAVKVVDVFLEAFEIGDIAVKLEITGAIKMECKDSVLHAKNEYREKVESKHAAAEKDSNLKVFGEVEFCLKALARGKWNSPDSWALSAGADVHAEAGLKGRVAASKEIWEELHGAYEKELNALGYFQFSKKDELKEKLLELEALKQNGLENEVVGHNGKLIAQTRVGFSGLIVYTICYAELSVSLTTYKAEPPYAVYQTGQGASWKEESKEAKVGRTWEKGSKEAKEQARLWPDVFLYKNDIELT